MPRPALLALALLLLVPAARAQEAARPQNLILLIGDGFGHPAATLAREYQGEPLALDAVLVGGVRTPSTDSRVTDSAAGATAYASGIKTYNGAVGVDTLRRPVGTLLEAAEARGMATGLVATSTITHATPAAFAAHVPDRSAEEAIAVQMLERGAEVLLGGGTHFFLPQPEGRREDGRDLVAEAREAGYAVVFGPEELAAVEVAPVLGLFTAGQMSYDVDRDPAEEPSLAEMTRKALDLLGGADGGFFLMVEGSRIDHAAHGNDPVGVLHDVLAFDAAARVALAFARAHGNTLVVATADHETGGMTLGRDNVYAWQPEVLGGVRASAEALAARVRTLAAADSAEVTAALVEAVLAEAGVPLDTTASADLAEIEAAFRGRPGDPARRIAHLVSRRAGVGWTTAGHTGVDVALYAFGPGSERFRGTMPNDAVGRALADLLGLDLDAVTERLRAEDAAVGTGG